MFNFTTLTVYNSLQVGKNLFTSTGGKRPQLRVGNTRFNAKDIVDVQVKSPQNESLASVTFDLTSHMPTSTEGTKQYRIALYIGLSMNSQDSFYANDMTYKGKPFYIEFSASYGENPGDVALRLVNIANKYMVFTTQEKILTITAEKSAPSVGADPVEDGRITFTGTNGYQQFKKAVLQEWDPDYYIPDGCCGKMGEFVDKVIGVPVIYKIASGTVELYQDETTHKYQKLDEKGKAIDLAANEVPIAPGVEAFGDYNWIIHNLRLPTCNNTSFWSTSKEEMPIVGAKYTQFIITLTAQVRGVAGQVVGQEATSVTTHVLYVQGLYTQAGTPAKALYDILTGSSTGQLNLSSKVKDDADDAIADISNLFT